MVERPAVHAGSWYLEGSKLVSLLKELDSHIEVRPTTSAIKAIIVPHAGFRYSGYTAAVAYKTLACSREWQRLIILGPLHQYWRHDSSCFYTQFTSVNTTIGTLTVESCPDSMRNNPNFASLPSEVDLREHSIEMQYPMIKYFMPNVKIMPLMIRGDLNDLEECSHYIAELLSDTYTALVISTDFCHYGSRYGYMPDLQQYHLPNLYERIEKLNEEGMASIASNDSAQFSKYLHKTKNTICGKDSVILGMKALRKICPEGTWTWLHTSVSSQIMDPIKEYSVSYVAGQFSQ